MTTSSAAPTRPRRGASPRATRAALGLALALRLTAPALAAPAPAPLTPPPTAPDAAPAAVLPPPTAPDAAPAPTPALADLARGDAAWWAGDRATAVAAWRAALARAVGGDGARPGDPGAVDRAPDPRDRAAEAMARIRLLQVSGNLGPFVHEGPLGRALAACPDGEPWCAIAWADYDLFMPAFTGADPSRVAPALAGSALVGPAAARIAAATGEPSALDALPDAALDGMGRGLRATGRRRPPAPGTWTLGIGFGGAPGAGFGAVVRFLHPDLAWRGHRLDLLAAADTRGGFQTAASLYTATRPRISVGVGAGRGRGDTYRDGAPIPYTLLGARASGAVVVGERGVSAVLGGGVRYDALDAPPDVPGAGSRALVAGPTAALTLGQLGRNGLRLAADAGFGDYTHLSLGLDARGRAPLLGGTLALRGAATVVPTASPFYRLPSAGGTDLLRGLPEARHRASALVAGQAEYRHALVGPLEGALFVDTAWVAGPHATAGAGLRLVLPPDEDNVTRLDIGGGPEGWGVVVDIGQAF